MRSIAIINQKGGVGKTTTTVHVAAGLARANRRTLLVDLDPQAHTSLHFGVQPADDEPSVYDVLVHDVPPSRALRDLDGQLVLLPATIDLIGTELELGARENRDLILANALDALQDGFDFCLIDCPPSLGLLTINALAAVDEVIIPLQPHFLALQGLSRLLETVTLVRGVLNPRLHVTGVILCMFERGTRLAQEVLADTTEFFRGADPDEAWHGARVFDTKIRRNIKLAECPSFGQTVYDYAPHSHGAEDYLALAREVLGMTTAPTVQPPDAAAAPDQPSKLASEPVSQPVQHVAPQPDDGSPPVWPLAPMPAPASAEPAASAASPSAPDDNLP